MGLILKFAILPPQRDWLLFTAENAEVNRKRKAPHFFAFSAPVASGRWYRGLRWAVAYSSGSVTRKHSINSWIFSCLSRFSSRESDISIDFSGRTPEQQSLYFP